MSHISKLAKKAYESKYSILEGISVAVEGASILGTAYFAYQKEIPYAACTFFAAGAARIFTNFCSRKQTLEEISRDYCLTPKQKQKEFEFPEDAEEKEQIYPMNLKR